MSMHSETNPELIENIISGHYISCPDPLKEVYYYLMLSALHISETGTISG